MERRKKVSRMSAPTFAENSLWDVWAFPFVRHYTLQPVVIKEAFVVISQLF